VDHRIGATVLNAQSVVGHKLSAGPSATSTKNASVVIHDKVVTSGVNGKSLGVGRIDPMVYSIAVPKRLQFTVTRHFAVHAVVVALREQQVQYESPRRTHSLRFCLDLHALSDGESASRLKRCHSLYLNQTHPTGAKGIQCWMITKRWNVNAG
jgi:hypothetical protein